MTNSDETLAYIAVGANLGNRAANLHAAIERLKASPGVRVTAVSSFLENPAVGGPDDSPPFLNAAVEVRTTLGPRQLLELLLATERQMGRVREKKWGPRLIDLDLILFGDQIIDTPTLKVPHPLMHERNFVLKPLAEIAPILVHPVRRRSVSELLAEFDHQSSKGSILLPPLSGSLSFRPATNADGASVRSLVFGVLREYGLQPDPESTDRDLFDLEGFYGEAGGWFGVLVDAENQVRGTVGLRPVDRETVELRKMYLDRSIRGNGWGKRLLSKAIETARSLGYRRMTLETASVLVEAISLYRKSGFREYRPAHMVPRCDQAFELILSADKS